MKIKTDVKELQLGMYVAELDRPWLESPFLFQGFRINTQDELSEVVRVCKYVYVDIDKSVFRDEEARSRLLATAQTTILQEEGRAAPPSECAVKFEEEVKNAKALHVEAENYISRVFDGLRSGGELDVREAKAVVTEMMDSIIRNPDALVLLSNLKAYDERVVSHSINVCTLTLAFGRFLGLSKEQLHELGLAGLLHDIGETKVPHVILKKRYGLNAEESELMQRHTEYGAEILRNQKDIPPSAAEVAYSHHEKINGKGYPRGLKGDEISLFARIIAIADVYDRITHITQQQRFVTGTDALKNMYDYRGKFFDGELMEQFIQCLGIYPVGSVVELNTGEVGIVISVPTENRLLPKVLLVRDRKKKPISLPNIINLIHYKSEDKGAKYSIEKVLQPDAYGIDLKKYMLREFAST